MSEVNMPPPSQLSQYLNSPEGTPAPKMPALPPLPTPPGTHPTSAAIGVASRIREILPDPGTGSNPEIQIKATNLNNAGPKNQGIKKMLAPSLKKINKAGAFFREKIALFKSIRKSDQGLNKELGSKQPESIENKARKSSISSASLNTEESPIDLRRPLWETLGKAASLTRLVDSTSDPKTLKKLEHEIGNELIFLAKRQLEPGLNANLVNQYTSLLDKIKDLT